MGLTETGFVRRTYDDILNAKIEKAKELFGQDIDTSEQTPLGKFIRINAYDQALAEEEIELVYYSHFPSTAKGQSLDRLLVFAGISRTPATAAAYKVKVTGQPGYTVPIGFLVGTDTDLTFYNVEDTVIGENGTCTITVHCTETGTIGNVSATAINNIVNPDANIASASGTEYVSDGTNRETDAELRERFKGAIQGVGSCNEAAIRSALLRVPTVTSAIVIVNYTLETDSDGRPPKSFECYVNGGGNYRQEIAESIFSKKPIGVKTHGQESEAVIDSGGYSHEIKFSYCQQIVMDVAITVKVNTKFEQSGAADIENNVREHINGLGIGEAVIPSAIYGHIYSVEGVKEVTGLSISSAGVSYSGNLALEAWQIAQCGTVTVSVVAA